MRVDPAPRTCKRSGHLARRQRLARPGSAQAAATVQHRRQLIDAGLRPAGQRKRLPPRVLRLATAAGGAAGSGAPRQQMSDADAGDVRPRPTAPSAAATAVGGAGASGSVAPGWVAPSRGARAATTEPGTAAQRAAAWQACVAGARRVATEVRA